MTNLHRALAPVTEAAWAQIEDETRRTFTRHVAARRVVDVDGPAGPSLSGIGTGHVREVVGAPVGVRLRVREVRPVVELRVPFRVSRQAVDDVGRGSQDSDWGPVKEAAQTMAFAEDRAIFDGLAAADIRGIRPSSSHDVISIPPDARGIPDAVAQAVSVLRLAGVGGPYRLLLSAPVYTAVAETTDQGHPVLRHVRRLLGESDETERGGEVVWAPAIEGGLLVSTRGDDYQLCLGEDLSIGYLSHDEQAVELYLEESFTFLAFTAEASVPLGSAQQVDEET